MEGTLNAGLGEISSGQECYTNTDISFFFSPWIHMCTWLRINPFTPVGFLLCLPWTGEVQWKGTGLIFQRCLVCTYSSEVSGSWRCSTHSENHAWVGNFILSPRKTISFKNQIETFYLTWPLLRWIPSSFWKQKEV